MLSLDTSANAPSLVEQGSGLFFARELNPARKRVQGDITMEEYYVDDSEGFFGVFKRSAGKRAAGTIQHTSWAAAQAGSDQLNRLLDVIPVRVR